MQEIIDLTGGLKLSRTEVYMEAQEMEGLNEIMNEDDLDSEEEEFFFKVPGMGLPQTIKKLCMLNRFCLLLTNDR